MTDRVVNVVDFARARLPEFELLEEKLTDERLPRHLQRRTRSHRSKRRYRKNPSTPPTRRERRKRLIETRWPHEDGDKPRLLETHLWHAKRMKMTTVDGFVVAERRNDRGTRAASRSFLKHCVCCDRTYCRPVVVHASFHDVLRRFADPRFRCGETIVVETYLFRSFPSVPIGPGTLEAMGDAEVTRITVHPKCRQRLLDALEEDHLQVDSVPGGVNIFEVLGPASAEVVKKLNPTSQRARTFGIELRYEPGGDGSAQWCALIKAGAHAIGLNERRHILGVDLGIVPDDDDDGLVLRHPNDFPINDAGLKVRVRVVAVTKGVPAPGDVLLTEAARTIGAVTTGGFATGLGRGAGLGIVDLVAFRQLPLESSEEDDVSQYRRLAAFRSKASLHACVVTAIFDHFPSSSSE